MEKSVSPVPARSFPGKLKRKTKHKCEKSHLKHYKHSSPSAHRIIKLNLHFTVGLGLLRYLVMARSKSGHPPDSIIIIIVSYRSILSENVWSASWRTTYSETPSVWQLWGNTKVYSRLNIMDTNRSLLNDTDLDPDYDCFDLLLWKSIHYKTYNSLSPIALL